MGHFMRCCMEVLQTAKLDFTIFWVGAIAALTVINWNWWALAAIPIICAAPYLNLHVPCIRNLFYIFYPLHLLVIFFLVRFR